MKIFRIEVKDELYFLNDSELKFYSSLKGAIEGNQDLYIGFVNDTFTVAFGNWMDKLGNVKNRQLVKEIEGGKEVEKKYKAKTIREQMIDMQTIEYQPMSWSTIYTGGSGGVIGSTGSCVPSITSLGATSMPLAQPMIDNGTTHANYGIIYRGNGLISATSSDENLPITTQATWLNTYEDARIEQDRQRNEEQLRRYRDDFNRGRL
jgi:hypothetical protein